MKTHAFSNIKFLFSYAWNYKKSLFLFYVLNIIFTLIVYLSGILARRALISELTDARRVSSLVMVAAIFLVAACGAGFFKSYIKAFYVQILQELRAKHMRRIQRKSLKLELSLYEDPAKLNNEWKVYQAIQSFAMGIQAVYMRLFAISANLVTVCFYAWILASLNLLVLLFLFVNLAVVFYVTLRAQKHALKMDEERSPFYRKGFYLSRLMNDFSYGKDIRVYGLSNWIYHKARENFKSGIRL
jgi:ATP-binding cassette subfamily C protein